MQKAKIHKADSGGKHRTDGEFMSRRLKWLKDVMYLPGVTISDIRIAHEFTTFYVTLATSKKKFMETGVLSVNPSVSTLANAVGLSRRGAQYALQRMERLGCLKIKKNKGTGGRLNNPHTFILKTCAQVIAQVAGQDTCAQAEPNLCKPDAKTCAQATAHNPLRDNNPRAQKGRDGAAPGFAAPGVAAAPPARPVQPPDWSKLPSYLNSHKAVAAACERATPHFTPEHTALVPQLKTLGPAFSTPGFAALLLALFRSVNAVRVLLRRLPADNPLPVLSKKIREAYEDRERCRPHSLKAVAGMSVRSVNNMANQWNARAKEEEAA